MSNEIRENLRNAYNEHLNRRQMRRIVPSSVSSSAKLTPEDELQKQWFELMCKKDLSFCA